MNSSSAHISPWQALRIVASDIKIAHSIFALPFAILGACIAGPLGASASRDLATFGVKLLLIIVCMVLARTWAMLFNRLVDARFDALNPRTARRAFASGNLSSSFGWTIAAASIVGFVLTTTLFWILFNNPWPTYLSIPVLAWIGFYSITKRFTWLCHLFLGGALAASPLAAAIAIEPSRVLESPSLWYLSGFVLAWVAGFDVLYALQDETFDRQQGLHSIPAALGTNRALWLSRILHASGVASLVLADLSSTMLGPAFGAGIVIVTGLLILEHVIVATQWRGGQGKAALNMAFFTVNGVVSCVLGGLGIIDLLLRR
jgi:4-hydroxybenzoate polyprenyltransferase